MLPGETEGTPPEDGDYSVCLHCAEVAVYGSGGRDLYPITPEQRRALEADKGTWGEVKAAQFMARVSKFMREQL